jgi:hypothetical protein
MRNSPPKGEPGVTCRLAPYRGARLGTLANYAKNPNLPRRTRRLAGCVESMDYPLCLDFSVRLGSSLPPDRVSHHLRHFEAAGRQDTAPIGRT